MKNALFRSLRLYPALLRLGFAEAVAYRAEFFVWILSTTMPLVMLALWAAVAREAPVGRFDQDGFVAYFLATLLSRMLSGAWVVWVMVEEIRRGQLAQRLLRPVHPILTYSAENLAGIPLRLVLALPVAVLLLVAVGSEHLTGDGALLALYVLSLGGAWLINFLSMVVIGNLAFFLESALGVYSLFLAVHFVLSGYLVPLELFPDALRGAAEVLLFRFMVSFPVEILTDRLSVLETLVLLGWQWAWVIGLAGLAVLGWRAGLRRYAAFGG
jgi:ABC-2 type transport system permease protein